MFVGGDALGRLAVGQEAIAGATITTLPVTAGVFTLTGNAATLTPTAVATRATFAVAANAATFETFAATTRGTFAETGNAITLETFMAAVRATYSETGNAATFETFMADVVAAFALAGPALTFEVFMAEATGAFRLMGWAGPLLAQTGSFALVGNSVTFLVDIDVGVIIGMGGEPGQYALTGYPIAMQVQLPAAPGAFCWHFLRQWWTDPEPTVPASVWAAEADVPSSWSSSSTPANAWTAKATPGSSWAQVAEQIDNWSSPC